MSSSPRPSPMSINLVVELSFLWSDEYGNQIRPTDDYGNPIHQTGATGTGTGHMGQRSPMVAHQRLVLAMASDITRITMESQANFTVLEAHQVLAPFQGYVKSFLTVLYTAYEDDGHGGEDKGEPTRASSEG
ncbi:hypothetical protein GH714_015497 [Hevea brasiliensis]|uniref:Uncharacterized protein n=1 Tax=Hevea brasiliensis TaxID=3981 RepID=A0A6A6KS68_HEVBR|nr:hypothetical protein GH714_015497 [Hevea brasiliensis]